MARVENSCKVLQQALRACRSCRHGMQGQHRKHRDRSAEENWARSSCSMRSISIVLFQGSLPMPYEIAASPIMRTFRTLAIEDGRCLSEPLAKSQIIKTGTERAAPSHSWSRGCQGPVSSASCCWGGGGWAGTFRSYLPGRLEGALPRSRLSGFGTASADRLAGGGGGRERRGGKCGGRSPERRRRCIW